MRRLPHSPRLPSSANKRRSRDTPSCVFVSPRGQSPPAGSLRPSIHQVGRWLGILSGPGPCLDPCPCLCPGSCRPCPGHDRGRGLLAATRRRPELVSADRPRSRGSSCCRSAPDAVRPGRRPSLASLPAAAGHRAGPKLLGLSPGSGSATRTPLLAALAASGDCGRAETESRLRRSLLRRRPVERCRSPPGTASGSGSVPGCGEPRCPGARASGRAAGQGDSGPPGPLAKGAPARPSTRCSPCSRGCLEGRALSAGLAVPTPARLPSRGLQCWPAAEAAAARWPVEPTASDASSR